MRISRILILGVLLCCSLIGLADGFVCEVRIDNKFAEPSLWFGNARNEYAPAPPPDPINGTFYIINQDMEVGELAKLGKDIRKNGVLWKVYCGSNRILYFKGESGALPNLYYGYIKDSAVVSGAVENSQLLACKGTELVISTDMSKIEDYFQDLPVVVAFDVQLKEGWNMVCPTLKLTDASKTTLLNKNPMILNSRKIFTRATQADLVSNAVLWIYNKEEEMVILSGYKDNDWTLTVNRGCNLIGMVKETVRSERPSNISSIWKWNVTGYVLVEDDATLDKGQGYWIYGKK